MALLDITEYSELAVTRRGNPVMSGQEPSLVQQQVSVGAGSVQSAAFNESTEFVRIHSDVACRITFGASPTATTQSMRLSAGGTEFFGVQPGHKVAVIATT